MAACLLAAALALLLAAGAAQAQTSIKLVSNTGQSQSGTSGYSVDRAQSFMTGNNAAGYKLTSVTFPAFGAVTFPPTVRIESVGGDDKPGGSLGVLTLSLSGSTVTGVASGNGIDLDPNTTYFVVLFDSIISTSGYTWTNSVSEDAGAATGWSIGDGSLWDGDGTLDWNQTSTNSWRIAIHGYAKTAPPTVSAVEIVSTPSLDVDGDGTPETYGQGGEICIQVTFDAAVTVTGTPQLKIDMDLDETWGEKTANYESGSGTAKLTFAYEVVSNNLSTKGIAVLENMLALNGGTIVAASDGTTAATLTHSGLGHQTNHKVHGNTLTNNPSSCASLSTPSAPVAPDTTAPMPTRATVSGDRLRLSFDETLDRNSVPAAAAFTVTVDGSTAAPSAVGLSGSTVTLTLAEAVEPGAVVTVSYTPGGSPLRDAAGNDVAAFTDRPVRHGASEAQQRAFAGALASVASRTVAGALDNIGARLGDAVPAGLSLAGRSVPFGGSNTGGFDGYSPSGGVESRGMEAGDLLGSSAFSLALGAAEDGKGPKALRWGVWGRGDYGSFEGRAGADARYKGETRTGWLGADARGARWVAGLAVSRGTSETDYTLEGEKGRIETTLTALWPYGRWTFANGLELRGLAGAGSGTARHAPEGDAPRETSRLTMRAASLGVRQAFAPLDGFDLAARADASFARMQTGRGEEAIDGLRADSWRLRGGLEASKRFALKNDATLAPFAELAARRDGGDGVAGSGIELAGGVRYAAAGVSVEARGRWLAAHSAKGTRERGASLAMRFDPEAGGRGLSMSLTPRWGTPAGGDGALWRDGAPQASGASDAGALDARLGWGFALAPEAGGLLTPFAEAGLAGADDRRLRLGTRFEARGGALALELAGERYETTARPEHAVRLELRLGF